MGKTDLWQETFHFSMDKSKGSCDLEAIHAKRNLSFGIGHMKGFPDKRSEMKRFL